jgi:hypothetical protein
MTVLFWNIQKKDLSGSIARLMAIHGVDLVVLAEIPDTGDGMRARLARETNGAVFYANRPNALAGKTHVYSIHPSRFTVHRWGNPLGRLNVFEVRVPLFPRFVLGTVHLVSKVNASEEDQAEEANLVIGELHAQRQGLGVDPLMICGDFNLNPFERGMRSPRYFHSVMDQHLAQAVKRTVFGRQYPVLYNPMWSLFGDYSKGPPGTHFYSSSVHSTTHWQMFDQFLLSPELLNLAEISEVSILAGDGTEEFLTRSGRIRRGDVYSDHLPILIRLTRKP